MHYKFGFLSCLSAKVENAQDELCSLFWSVNYSDQRCCMDCRADWVEAKHICFWEIGPSRDQSFEPFTGWLKLKHVAPSCNSNHWTTCVKIVRHASLQKQSRFSDSISYCMTSDCMERPEATMLKVLEAHHYWNSCSWRQSNLDAAAFV